MLIFLILPIILHSEQSSALACNPLHPALEAYRKIPTHVRKTARSGLPDRKTLSDFALYTEQPEAVVAQKYAPTGDFACGNNFGQGQVVMKGDVLLTAAHVVYPGKSCNKKIALSKCLFTVTVEGEKLDYEVKEEVKKGFKCPQKKGQEEELKDDWVVLRLKKSVDGRIKPYNVDPSDVAKNHRGRGVIAVAKSKDFNPTNAKRMKDVVRHYGKCNIADLDDDSNPTAYETDCDVTGRGSGGSILNDSPRFTNLLAMIIAVDRDGKTGCPKFDPKLAVQPWVKNCNGTHVIPISGNLKAAIDEAAGGSKAPPANTPPSVPRRSQDIDL